MSTVSNEEQRNFNIELIKNQIRLKQQDTPHYGTMNINTSVITQIDHHPFTRFYRGVPYSTEPIIFERHAGLTRATIIPVDETDCSYIDTWMSCDQ
jgi:hypothetical protein